MNKIMLDDQRNFLIWREGSGRTVELFDIAVGTRRRKGLGRMLVERLLKEIPKSTSLVYAITRASNEVAQLFYEGIGWHVIGRLHRFHRDGGPGGVENAIMYGLDI